MGVSNLLSFCVYRVFGDRIGRMDAGDINVATHLFGSHTAQALPGRRRL